MLPRLKDLCSDRAMPLEDMLSEKGYDKILDFIDNLDSIGDLKVICITSKEIKNWFKNITLRFLQKLNR